MKITHARALLAGIAALTALALTSCGASVPGSAPASKGTLTQQQVIDEAPVADSLPDSPTLDAIRKAGTLQFGGSQDRPLFSQFNPATNTYEGFESGLAYAFAKYVLGKPEVAFTEVTPVNREALLQNGTVQFIVGGYSVTPQRAELVAFAGPYMESGTGVGILADNKELTSVADLDGKTIATFAGLTESAVIKAVPKAHVITFATTNELVSAIKHGRADAMALDMPSLLGAIANNKGTVKALSDEPITSLYFGFGLPKTDPVYKQVVNDWLEKIEKSGLYEKLWKATVGDIAPVPTPPQIGSVPGS